VKREAKSGRRLEKSKTKVRKNAYSKKFDLLRIAFIAFQKKAFGMSPEISLQKNTERCS